MTTLRRVRAALNPALDIDGVLLTMYDERTNLGAQVAANVREFFKEKVFETVIPRNVRLARGAEPRAAGDGLRREIARRGGVHRARARIPGKRHVPHSHDAETPRHEESSRQRRSAVAVKPRGSYGKTTCTWQRPQRAHPRRAGRAAGPRTTEVDVDRISPERAPAASSHSRTRASTSWHSRSRATASSSRSWCGRSTTAIASSPASAAGARRSAPGSPACRSSSRTWPPARRAAARDGAHREHPARRPESHR